MENKAIKLKKFMEDLAHLEAQGACESMGINPSDKDYDNFYSKVFHNFCVEAIEHSMTPGIYKNNPTTPKIAKSIVEKFALTGDYVKNNLRIGPKKDQVPSNEEIGFVTSQIRGAVNSLVNLVLYVQYGLRPESFQYKKDASEEDMKQVEINRYKRILVFVFLVRWTEGLITSDSLKAKNLDSLLNQFLPKDSKGEVTSANLKLAASRNKFVADATKAVEDTLKMIEKNQKA